MAPRFVHTNLTCRDLRALSAFYCEVFGCAPAMAPERYDADWVAAITGVPGASILVQHLRVPGHGAEGPTLELIEYADAEAAPAAIPNRPGFGHVAFAVDDVAAARKRVIAAGGAAGGEIVTVAIPGRGTVTEAYVRDPEGNLVEICRWR